MLAELFEGFEIKLQLYVGVAVVFRAKEENAFNTISFPVWAVSGL